MIGRRLRTAFIVLSAAAAAASSADISIGGSREQGMAGAGFAFPNSFGGRGYRNPALFGLRTEVKFFWPRFDASARGIGFSDLNDLVDLGGGGALNADTLGGFARTFGDRTSEFGLGSALGLQFGAFAIDFGGQAAGTTIPNAALQDWVESGSNLLSLPANAQLDGYGLGSYEAGLSAAREIISSSGIKLAVGGRAKFVRAYYTHSLATSAEILNGGSVLAGEMGGRESISDAGFGFDAGVHFTPKDRNGAYGGVLISNLIAPEVSFAALTPGTSPTLDGVIAFPRTVDGGLGFISGQVLFAADVVDAFNAAGRQDLRFGGEYLFAGRLALRGGVSSREGVVFGAGLGDFNFAFGARMPIEAGYAIRF
jgi:hypothetical protein